MNSWIKFIWCVLIHCCYDSYFFFLKEFLYLFIYFWLRWVFVSVRGLSLVAASGGHSSSRCAGLSPSRPLPLRSTSSRRAGSIVVAHGPSCSEACGIFPDQGSNPCPLHWQADSQPLRHQGSPYDSYWYLNCPTFDQWKLCYGCFCVCQCDGCQAILCYFHFYFPDFYHMNEFDHIHVFVGPFGFTH